MFYRIGSYFFFGLTVVLLGAAVVAFFWVPDEPGVTIDEPTREFPALAVGEHEVRFRLHNPTRHPVRIVGAGTC